MPIKRGGSLNVVASEEIGKVDVLEPKTVSWPIAAWALAIASSLTLRSSNTASIIKSQSFSAA